MSKKFSVSIFETPSDSENNWGETVYADRKRMIETIESLCELGEDWEHCSLGDCTEYNFVRALGNGEALYEGGWHTDSYNRNGRNGAVVFSHDNKTGFYRHVKTYDSVREFDRVNA